MWEIKDYDNSQLYSMLEMTKEYYGEIEISNEIFINHQYFSNPNGSAWINLAYDVENQRLAGQYIVIPTQIRIGGITYSCVLSLNTLTRSEYRGQKIFISLADNLYKKCADTGINFCYGAPNQNSHHGFVKKLGFRDIGMMPLWIRPMKASAFVHAKLKSKLLSIMAKPFDRLFQFKRTKSVAFDIQELTKNNLTMADNLWKNIQDKYPVMFNRDRAFLSWRYLDMPMRDYKIYVAFQESEPHGYIVCRITDVSGIKCGMIVDFIYEEHYVSAAKELIDAALSYFQENETALAGCLMQKHFSEAMELKRKGFFVCPKFLEPQPFPIIYRQFKNNMEKTIIEDFKNWFFTMGDYDVI